MTTRANGGNASSTPSPTPPAVDDDGRPKGRSTCTKCMLVVGGIIVAPIVIGLLLLMWLLRHIEIVALLEFIIVTSFFLNTSLHLSSSTVETLVWYDTIWDIQIITMVTTLLVYISESQCPWPSHTRRATFTTIAAGIIAFVITKWSAISGHTWATALGGGHAMLITLAIGASLQALSQWWLYSSRGHLKRAQDEVIAMELRDHFATPVDRRAFDIIEKHLAGVSYYLVDELPLQRAPPLSTTAAGTATTLAAVATEIKDSASASPTGVSLTFAEGATASVPVPSANDRAAYGTFVDHGANKNGTTSVSAASTKPFLVVLHGYMGGKAIFVPCFGSLAKHFRLVVIDVPGIGLCDRPKFRGRSAADAELFFSSRLEAFRVALLADHGLPASTPIWLLGHSYGGYIVADYTLRYPHAVAQLILASPVGLPIPPPPDQNPALNGRRRFFGPLTPVLMGLWNSHWINPQAVLRFFGPFGPWIVRRAVQWRFDGLPMHTRALANYLYHLNVTPDSGNATFTYILGPGAFARAPLRDRLLELKCPTHFVYGQYDWMDAVVGREVSKSLRERGVTSTHYICPDAGHQLFMENPNGFYQILLKMTGIPTPSHTKGE